MLSDRKLAKYLLLLLLFPLGLAMFSGDRFRYPCQDPDNWDKAECKLPKCDVTRTCPEHIFKGQRDPRLGPPDETAKNNSIAPPVVGTGNKGVSCGK